MSSAGKGNDWYFGSSEDQKRRPRRVFPTNAHIGADAESGAVHPAAAERVDQTVLKGKPTAIHLSILADIGWPSP